MVSLLNLILLIPAAPLVIEDFRERRVRLVWLLVLAALSLFISILYIGMRPAIVNILSNSALLLLTGTAVGLWFYARGSGAPGNRLHSLKRLLGAGDIVFLFALTPLFGPKEYVIFIISASVFSLCWWLCIMTLRRRNATIPFIGTAGILLCACMIIRTLW